MSSVVSVGSLVLSATEDLTDVKRIIAAKVARSLDQNMKRIIVPSKEVETTGLKFEQQMSFLRELIQKKFA